MAGDEAREVLERRARELARPLEAEAWGGALDVVRFRLAGETYAIEATHMLSVFRLGEISRLPGAEPPVFGVTAWRGDLLTVLDLRPVLGLPTAALDDLARVLVLGEEHAAFGVLADSVLDMARLPEAAVRPPPEGVAVRRDYVRGVGPDSVVVLDAAEILRLHG